MYAHLWNAGVRPSVWTMAPVLSGCESRARQAIVQPPEPTEQPAFPSMNHEHHDIVIIGAGLSGIGMACHLLADDPDADLVILEGRDSLGGTWDLFRYPGIRSDSDMHTLGYDFKPWRNPKAIADGPAILDYIRETAAEHDVERRIEYRQALKSAAWSSADSAWTLAVESAGVTRTICARVLIMCAGYYRYESGHTPEFPGSERFRGTIIHPQHWPRDFDHAGKRIVVIGSGATAVTLVPELAKTAESVTMLQRSPTYMIAFPDVDHIANILRWLLPEQLAYRLTRWKNIRLQRLIFRLARRRPGFVRRLLVGHARRTLGKDYDVDTHFNPAYNPWEQRLCLVPNNDFFDSISAGHATVVTDHIETFTESGLRTRSGLELEADVIVTATGLELQLMGGADFSVDGEPVDFGKRFTYRGTMIDGVPNMVSAFGYINASWTLRADLVARFTCRLLAHMQKSGTAVCTPTRRETDRDMQPQAYLTGFSSGYLLRVMDQLPKQGDREPWLNPQDYLADRARFLDEPLDDGVLVFTPAAATGDMSNTTDAPEKAVATS